ncbi:MAG: DivIVA domain-containing protein [Actinomycetota bacterium]
MTITPQDIQNKEFREAFRGYNQDEVDTFLDDIAEDYGQLYQQVQRLKLEIASKQDQRAPAPQSSLAAQSTVAPQPAPQMQADSGLRSSERAEAREEMKRALVATQRAAEAALDEAKRRAGEIVARAEQRAKEIDEMTARRAKDVDVDAGSALTHAQERVEELKRQEVELRSRLRRMLAEHIKMLQQLEGDAVAAHVPQASEPAKRDSLWLSPRERQGTSNVSPPAPTTEPSESDSPREKTESDHTESDQAAPGTQTNGMVARMARALGEPAYPGERSNGLQPIRNGLGGPDKRDSFWRR